MSFVFDISLDPIFVKKTISYEDIRDGPLDI